jgi:hypothetical protein
MISVVNSKVSSYHEAVCADHIIALLIFAVISDRRLIAQQVIIVMNISLPGQSARVPQGREPILHIVHRTIRFSVSSECCVI